MNEAFSSASWLIERSRELAKSGDASSAEAWLITATSLYPDSFAVQHEVLRTQLETGQIQQAADQLEIMLQKFEKSSELWRDVRGIVNALDSVEINTEIRTQKKLFNLLKPEVQQNLLQSCADMCKEDVLKHSRMLLKLMKLYPSAIEKYGLKTVKRLSQSEMTSETRDLLVSEALPLVLSSSSAMRSATHDDVINWLLVSLLSCLDLCVGQIFATSADFSDSVSLNPAVNRRRSSIGVRLLLEDVVTETWASFFELFRGLAHVEEMDVPEVFFNLSSNGLRDRLSHLLDSSSPSFYAVASLYFESMIKYFALVKTAGVAECPLFMICSWNSESSDSITILGDSCADEELVIESFRVAHSCWEIIHSEPSFNTKFKTFLKENRNRDWSWMEAFESDCLLFTKTFSRLIPKLQESIQKNEEMTEKQRNIAKMKLASGFFYSGKIESSSQCALEVLQSLLETHTSEPQRDYFNVTSLDQGCSVVIMAYDVTYLFPVCVKFIVEEAKTSSFGPERNDVSLSRLLVFIQFNWPEYQHLLSDVLQKIVQNGGFAFENFFNYITNIHLLEEFLFLVNVDTKLRLMPSTLRQRTVTRGFDKENKEEVRSAFEKQVTRTRENPLKSIKDFFKGETSTA